MASKTFIIAEIGWNFDGSLEKAKQLIDAAVRAGCSAVKFQSFTAEKLFNEFLDYAPKPGKDWIKIIREHELPKEWHFELADYCKQKGIVFFSSACDEGKVDWLVELGVPFLKVPSYELTHIPLLRYMAKTGKPIILSSGIATEEEIGESIEAIRSEGNNDITLMHCVSAYPTESCDLNLGAIPYYIEKFGIRIGLSDHFPGIWSSALAVCLGAKAVEKHITLDRSASGGDHSFAMDPEMMKKWVGLSRQAEENPDETKDWIFMEYPEAQRALGTKSGPAKGEEDQVVWRRSLWAKEDIPAGTAIAKDMVMIVRPSPEGSLPPKEICNVVGKKAKREIKKGGMITSDGLE
ncbi:MAG: N-acetylneuraminate synthase family protein [bacterium]|nr:N-acetylneuraminate synthase family protein [bacterium]